MVLVNLRFVTGMHGYWEKNVMEMSHGEGFLEVLDTMFTEPGLYLLDEPEAALSFSSCFHLIAIINRLSGIGAQVICATHSPLLTALPGADILELSMDGINRVLWKKLELVDHWQRFLSNPSIYLRHIMNEEK